MSQRSLFLICRTNTRSSVLEHLRRWQRFSCLDTTVGPPRARERDSGRPSTSVMRKSSRAAMRRTHRLDSAGPIAFSQCGVLTSQILPRRHDTPQNHRTRADPRAHHGVHGGDQHPSPTRRSKTRTNAKPRSRAGRRILASAPRHVQWRRPRGSPLSQQVASQCHPTAVRQRSLSSPRPITDSAAPRSHARISSVRQHTRLPIGSRLPFGSGRRSRRRDPTRPDIPQLRPRRWRSSK